jgi:hypothetical protein
VHAPQPTRTLGLALAVAVTAITVPHALAAPGKQSPQRTAAVRDGRSPDTKDASLNAHRSRLAQSAQAASAWSPLNGSAYDGRSPDTKDAAAAVHSTTSP